MPLCTIHLLALHPTPSSADPLPPFLSALRSTPTLTPLVTARVLRWIILPTTHSTSPLLAHNHKWHLLLILPSTQTLPTPLTTHLAAHWHITAGIPSRLTTDFATKNAAYLHPDPASVPPLQDSASRTTTTPSAQNLELSTELATWLSAFSTSPSPHATAPVSMLNLLSFHPTKKPSYLAYGAAFASSVGAAHGGNAKLVGGVVDVDGVPRAKGQPDGEGWDEVALAQYPSARHFAAMLADEGYQGVNREFRVPSLRDTAILMTCEVGLEDGEGEGGGERARL